MVDLFCMVKLVSTLLVSVEQVELEPAAVTLIYPLLHLQMEHHQQQLKEQQSKLQKASKQAQEAGAKAAAQQQVSFCPLQSCCNCEL